MCVLVVETVTGQSLDVRKDGRFYFIEILGEFIYVALCERRNRNPLHIAGVFAVILKLAIIYVDRIENRITMDLAIPHLMQNWVDIFLREVSHHVVHRGVEQPCHRPIPIGTGE